MSLTLLQNLDAVLSKLPNVIEVRYANNSAFNHIDFIGRLRDGAAPDEEIYEPMIQLMLQSARNPANK